MTDSKASADIIIRGGTIIDGTGRPRFRGDVAIQEGKIAALGDLSHSRGRQELSAEGLIVAPGFIDAHAHSDTAFTRDDSGASKLYQGVTTEISGNCGDSPFPAAPRNKDPWQLPSFSDFLNAFQEHGCRMAVNQALLMGHGTLREAVIGEGNRPASPTEMAEMQRLLRRDLEAGAWGLSLGLEYAPGCFADQAELNALGQTVAEAGGIVTCHMRSEGLHIDSALAELAEIGRSSGAHVHASHLKLDNYTVHGRASQVWDFIERVNREGIQFTADTYPYTASSTTLSIRCPRWSMDGGREGLLRNLQGPRRQEIIDDFDASPVGKVLAAQIIAGGTGLNIQSASVVILCEPQLKPSIENQAISRAYRMGQGRNVLVYRLLCENTIDERIMKLLEDKQKIFDAFADKSVAVEKIEVDNRSLENLIQEEIDRINNKRQSA